MKVQPKCFTQPGISNKGLGHLTNLSIYKRHIYYRMQTKASDKGMPQPHYIIITWIREHGAKQIELTTQ